MEITSKSYLSQRIEGDGKLLKSVKDDVKCQTCIFYGLCTKAELSHCLGSDYYEDSSPKEKKN
ncbi:hypothetical protein ACWKTS_05035 [Bacillus toyonensis]|uniref:hypothetical protein n=1 Tax=Bacillus toyonensis TaxID=155322 RepID=UPI001596BCC1|nr:hypothetical protein [Bacillus toyonensis]